MNKFFLTVVLFLLTFSIYAFSQADQELLIRQSPIEFQPFAHRTEQPMMWDFSNPYHYENWREVGPGLYVPSEPAGFTRPYAAWYIDDFPKEPFDGRVEITVMGEPLPTELMTLCIMLAFAGIISWKRIRLQPT